MNLTAVGWLQAVQTSALFVSICSILKLIQTLSPSVNMSDVSNETESHCIVFLNQFRDSFIVLIVYTQVNKKP